MTTLKTENHNAN